MNISQEELAEVLGVTFASVNRWENGRAVPNKITQSYSKNMMFHTMAPEIAIEDLKEIYNQKKH